MREALAAYRTRGWAEFGYDPAVAAWVHACRPIAERLPDDPVHARWMRCDGTWFAGVNALGNDEHGAWSEAGIPPLPGAAVDFIHGDLGYREFAWDRAQISIVYPGYPRLGAEETEAAWRYRVRRCAAHVDGLERVMPGRRRKLSETHGFILGLPLTDADTEHGAFVIWEGSHEVMRAAFREAFGALPPARWREIDVTDAYTAARSRCFEVCPAREIAPGPGGAYVVHPLALHGVAPWRGEDDAPPRSVAYFRPDPFRGDPARWLAA